VQQGFQPGYANKTALKNSHFLNISQANNAHYRGVGSRC
jgi:hypothetical protein